MPTLSAELSRAWRAVRPGRLFVVLGLALVAGLLGDWLRPEQRLVFRRPLPAFKTAAPSR